MSRWSKSARLPFVGVIAWIALGCTEAPEEAAWLVRDSADVRVVENLRPAWEAGQAWRVFETPALEIGVEEGEEPYMLFRAMDALRLPDGRIVVSNAGSGELRFFDHEGVFLYSAGRHGQGPGEFGEFSSMRLWSAPRDILVVTDGGNNRVNFFRTTGEHVGSARVEAVPGRNPPSVISGFGDGTWLAVGGSGPLTGATGQIIQGAREYFHYNANGSPADNLFELQQAQRYVHTLGDVTHYPYIPLTAQPSVAAGVLWIYVGNGHSSRMERRRLDGNLNSVIRWSEGEQRRSRDVYDRFVDESLQSISSMERRELYRHYLGLDLPLPEFIPAYQNLIVDDIGNVWVEAYRLPWERQPVWEVFDPDGRWLGSIETPTSFRPLQIGGDFLLGRHRDELGVERIRLYELIKPQPAG